MYYTTFVVSCPAGFSVLTYDRDMAKPVVSNVANKLHHCLVTVASSGGYTLVTLSRAVTP